MFLDWLIIGGGVQGSHLALVLRHRLGVAADALRVIDDAPAPLAAWKQRAAACGMEFLRSPQAHHLGLRADALRRISCRHGPHSGNFLGPYRRPSTALFAAHAEALVAAEPPGLRARDRVERIEALAGGYRVVARRQSWLTRRLLLAPGPAGPLRPRWAADLAHVFDLDYAAPITARGTVAVIGGGISAAQTALALAHRSREVVLVAPRAMRIADFDAAPCYAGPKCLEPFAAGGWRRRRRHITAARYPGSLPRDVAQRLRQAVARGAIRVQLGYATGTGDRGVRLANGHELPATEVVLATGLARDLPGGPLVQDLIANLDLPLAPCGFPAPMPDLQWRPGLFVSGALAELELGPMAANIRGARLAGERLRHALRLN